MITLAEVLDGVFSSLMSSVHTCLPGRVESFDYQARKATVKPLLKKQFLDGTVLPLPVLVNVPVVFPCTETAGVVFPVNKGDGVLIVFAERALERWLSSGEDSEPGDPRKFDLSDGVAIPGLFSFRQESFAPNNEDLVVRNAGQTVTVKANGDVEIGGASLKKLVTDEFVTLFNNHTHDYFPSTTPAPTPVPTAAPLVPMTSAHLTAKVSAQ